MKELNILYQTDNNYAVYTGVSITSLFINNKDIDSIVVYVIDDNISTDNKEKLLKTAENYGREMIFLDLSEGVRILEGMGAPKYRNSYAPYLRLFAFNLLPDSVSRIFYIDSDTVVVGSLDEVIDMDMGGCVIGAVRDGLTHSYKMAFGYDYNDSWFNSGVMLVDVDKWKSSGAQKKAIEQLKKRTAYVAPDQDILNITQHGNIMTLHPKYNATPHHYVYSEKHFRRAFPQGGFYDSYEIMEEARTNAVIRHFERFIGESAWNLGTIHPYAKFFDEYLSQSLWSDYEKKPANLKGALKIESILYRILPKNVFVYIFGFAFRHYLSSTSKKLMTDSNMKNIT